MQEARKILVLYGGNSSEREVSLKSGTAINQALTNLGIDSELLDFQNNLEFDSFKLYDKIFIALHGNEGESGDLQQKLLEHNISFTGSHPQACRKTWDKEVCKQILQQHDIPTPPWISERKLQRNFDFQKKLAPLQPCKSFFMKPAQDGSSIDTHEIYDQESFEKAFDKCRNTNRKFIFEQTINTRELTVGMLGDIILPPLEISTNKAFYNYEAKYLADDTSYVLPNFDSQKEKKLLTLAEKTFKVMECKGWARVDFVEDENEEFYVLEVNTVPGMTSHSLLPKAAKLINIDYDEVVGIIVEA